MRGPSAEEAGGLTIVVHRPPLISINQGNAQALPRGHLLVGWGHEPYVTEYDRYGHVLLDLRFAGVLNSYRAFRYQWVGRPTGRPSTAIYRGRLYASWNGATQIAYWQLLAGPMISAMRATRTVPRQDFETSLPAPRHAWIVDADPSPSLRRRTTIGFNQLSEAPPHASWSAS